MAANQQFCLRWNNHQRTLISVFDSLLESGTLVDCTLAAEGQYLKAHKVVLSACSPYLGVLLSSHHEKHPILILKDIKFQELKAMLDYMYRGEVNISQEQLCTFLKAAESLQIKGLTESAGLNPDNREFEDRLAKRPAERKTNSSTQPIPNHNARTRSPPTNAVNTTSESAWPQKYSSSNYRSISPVSRRDGSLSPTARKRRKQQHPMPSVEESNGTPTTTASAISVSPSAIVENHQDGTADPLHESLVNSVSSSNSNTLSMNVNNIKTENTDKINNDNESRSTDSVNSSITNCSKSNDLSAVPKQEPRYDDRSSDADAAYEDSVEDMTIEDEEEEVDENDLSRPGPSHSDDSQNFGSASYPLSTINDGASGQLDCQEPVTDPLAVQRFVCRLCGKLYQWKQSLTRHIREDRCDKGPQHACPRCGIIFKHTTRLNRHLLFCPNVQMGNSNNENSKPTEKALSQSATVAIANAIASLTTTNAASSDPLSQQSSNTSSSDPLSQPISSNSSSTTLTSTFRSPTTTTLT